MLFSYPVLAQIPSNPQETQEEIDEIEDKKKRGKHHFGSGFPIVEGKTGSLVFSFNTSVRYLNQAGLDDTYTFSDGTSIDLDLRNDIQFHKAMLYFRGYLLDPKFRYVFYIWTANVSMGLGAQVVVAGNFQYEINKYLDVGVGIGGLPTSRAMLGQFPGWLRQDARVMAEEFFRGSFTTGIWLQGELANNLYYKAMLGNNLSQMGVDAAQLDNGFDTFSGALWWNTGNFGRVAPFGDFDKHQNLATRLGAAYSRSNETAESQPGSEDPENTQLRFSDGRTLFGFGNVAPSVAVREVKYEMNSIHAGLKYRGFSLSAEHYFRWLTVLEASGPVPTTSFRDQGWYLKSSYMVIDKTLMLYAHTSRVNGEFGDPTEMGFGLNFYPVKQRFFRLNVEVVNINNSPVGYLSYPLIVGADGYVFVANIEVNF